MTGGAQLTAEQVETVLSALHDAKWARVGLSVNCPDCDATEVRTRHAEETCERHTADLEQAERYNALLLLLGGEA